MLISPKNVACVDLVLNIVENRVVAVGDDGVALGLESVEVADNLRAEEHCAVFQGGLIDDNLCTLSLDALHNTLDR